MLSGQQHAIAHLKQKHQRQLADLIQQLADAEQRVKCEEVAAGSLDDTSKRIESIETAARQGSAT